MTFQSLSEIEEKEIVPGFNAKFLHSENMTFAFWRIDKGSTLPLHSHPQEQVSTITKGTFELTIGSVTKIIKKGDVAIIPPDVNHTGKAVTDCCIIDVFHPIRDDYA